MEIYWQKKSDTTPLSGDFGSAVAKLMNFAYILSKHVSIYPLIAWWIFPVRYVKPVDQRASRQNTE